MRAIRIVERRLLPATAAVLAVTCALQLMLYPFVPQTRVSASWANLATSLDEAKALSSVILVGHVERVVLQSDITVLATGEPGGVDRVPVEVVRVAVDRVYKGNVPSAIGLFHTALARPGSAAQALGPDEATPSTEATPGVPVEMESRNVLLDGDPAYEPGEHYLLFLRAGPTLEGATTLAAIGPEGRYRLDWPGAFRDDSQIHALTTRGVAPQLDGHSVGEVGSQMVERATPGRSANRAGRTSTRNIIGGILGAAVIGTVLARGDAPATPNPNSDRSTTPKSSTPGRAGDATGLGAPRNLRPGAATPENAPSLRADVAGAVTLSWEPPAAGTAARYDAVVARESPSGLRIFARTVTGAAVRVPSSRLTPGLYAWSVRALDATQIPGPGAATAYFKVGPAPSSAAAGSTVHRGRKPAVTPRSDFDFPTKRESPLGERRSPAFPATPLYGGRVRATSLPNPG